MLGDLLFIYQLKHFPLPKELSQKDAITIIAASKGIFKKSIVAKGPGKLLLHEISHRLKEAALQKTKFKYVLYSAHDSTIMSLMNAMGASIQEVPDYASDLNIALFERSNHKYYVQVTLNNQKVELPNTKGKDCSLENFLAWEKNFPKS